MHKKIPIKLTGHQWSVFRPCLHEAIIELDADIKEDKHRIDLKMVASLLNELLIKIDTAIARQMFKYTLPLTPPQAFALHMAYTDKYLQGDGVFSTSIIVTQLIPTIDKAV